MLRPIKGLYVSWPADPKHGWAARFAREDLLQMDSTLRPLLARETSIGGVR